MVGLVATHSAGATPIEMLSGGNTVATVTGGSVGQAFTFAGTVIGAGLVLGSDAAGGATITHACLAEGNGSRCRAARRRWKTSAPACRC